MPPNTLLIDVRSASEFATGHLTSDLCPTLNIEYQTISALPSIYASTLGLDVTKDDDITLYCRSGRRSDIALRELKGLGFRNVRDIGGYEEARRTLDRETVGRQIEREIGGEEVGGEEVGEGGSGGVKDGEGGKVGGEKREKSFGALLDGLKALDG